MRKTVTFNGTSIESSDLLHCLEEYCTCQNNDGVRVICPSHKAMVESQRFLDGLLFARNIRERLVTEEWHEG